MPADYFNARCYATRRTLPSLPTMNHTVTNPIKLSLHSFRGWRISPRKRPDGRWHDGARSISRSSKSIDRKEEISKMIINTSIIARFQFHPRYRSLLWESCTRPNGDAWLSERSVGFLDTRFTLTSGNINDQHSFLYERSNLHDPIEETILELFSSILSSPCIARNDQIYDGARCLLIGAPDEKVAQIVTRFLNDSFLPLLSARNLSKKRRKLGKCYFEFVFLAHRVCTRTKFMGKINTRRNGVFILCFRTNG